jgi:Asp-tRNA(Asn)/Glu-tRNA(Gln) amidotransferase A subunit family amidase
MAGFNADYFADQTPSRLPRIGVIRDYPWGAAQPEAERGLSEWLTWAKIQGCSIHDITLPGSASVAFDAHATVQNFEAYRALAWVFDNHQHRLSNTLRSLLIEARAITIAQYKLAQQQVAEARSDLNRVYERVDCLVLPSAPGAPPQRTSTGTSTFNRLWTATGNPCISLPEWTTDALGLRVPVGIQLVGPINDDARFLQFARLLHRPT